VTSRKAKGKEMSETKEQPLISEDEFVQRLKAAWEKYDKAHQAVFAEDAAITDALTKKYNAAMEPFREKRKAALQPLIEEYERDVAAAKAAFGDQPRTFDDTTT